MKSSLQRELDSFYKEGNESDFNIRHVTKGAFSQARAKLKPEAFIELNNNVVKPSTKKLHGLCGVVFDCWQLMVRG